MATLFRGKYRVESARLRGWDYASDASYFVTICTKNKQHFFGKIIDGKMRLNALGEIVFDEWLRTSKVRPNVVLDEFIIMPNHVHGIIIIKYPVETTRRVVSTLKSNSIGSIIGQFKSIATKTIHQRYPQSHFSWQPGFYDHIIRSERSWFFIREYISNNPANWATDKWFQHVPDAVPPA